MDKICVLLNGPIQNDHRVIKIVHTLSKKYSVDLFYVSGNPEDKFLLPHNVRLWLRYDEPESGATMALYVLEGVGPRAVDTLLRGSCALLGPQSSRRQGEK